MTLISRSRSAKDHCFSSQITVQPLAMKPSSQMTRSPTPAKAPVIPPQLLPYQGIYPTVPDTVLLVPGAAIIGDVVVGDHCSFWFHTATRGDVNFIRIGSRTNIQDHSMLHVTRKTSPLMIGDDVTVGHRVTLHGCTIKNRILVGMGATVMDDAIIEDDCMIAAGSLVTKGKHFGPGVLIQGAPAKVVRELTPEERAFLLISSQNYQRDTAIYLEEYRRLGIIPERYERFR